MKSLFGIALLVACLAAASPFLYAQTPESGDAPGSGQNHPAESSQNPRGEIRTGAAAFSHAHAD
ncbi:MAG: hypothetical protein WDM87_12595 [Terracidiphilus sp.]